MDTVFTVCIIVGFAIPLLTLVFGGLLEVDGFDGDIDGLDFGFDLPLGDVCICFLPLSVHSICTGLLLFGVMGKILDGTLSPWLLLLIALIVGYCGAVVIQSLIRTLKRVEHTTYSKDQLLLFDGHIVNTVVAGGFGSVSVSTMDGITRSFPAKAENPTQVIRQGTQVTIVAFDGNTAIVKKKDIGEKYHLAHEESAEGKH